MNAQTIKDKNSLSRPKGVSFVQRVTEGHWVGDGFPVRTMFSYNDLASELSPFLLLDYAGPVNFPPTEHRRGVGEHPHRGFETVTIVYDGEVEHRDSAGGGGKIGAGDVQWMTAASGLVHEEFHGTEYGKRGGPFEMIQLWVNLPKKDKMTKPGYQSIVSDSIPNITLPDSAGSVRVIAGEYSGKNGPARTFSPMNVWDVKMHAGKSAEFSVRSGDTTAVFVMKGRLRLRSGDEVTAEFPSGVTSIGEAELAILERDGETFRLEATEDAKFVILNGTPLNEPVVGYGPFVMNTEAEIRQAFVDFQSGKMGSISPVG